MAYFEYPKSNPDPRQVRIREVPTISTSNEGHSQDHVFLRESVLMPVSWVIGHVVLGLVPINPLGSNRQTPDRKGHAFHLERRLLAAVTVNRH
jgi:hypothetical protein